MKAGGLFRTVPPRVRWLIYLLSFSNVGTGYYWVATSAYLPEIGISNVDVGLLLALNGISFIVTAIPLGLLADRIGRRKILLWGLLGVPPALLIYALTSELQWLVVASIVAGVAEGGFLTTWNALIADLTEPENRQEAFALSFVLSSFSGAVGFALPLAFPSLESALALSSHDVHSAFFVILAVAAAVTPVTIHRLLNDYQETSFNGAKIRKGRNIRPLLKFSAYNGLIGLGAGFIIPLIPTWLLVRFGLPDSVSGPLLAVSSMTIAFASIGSAWLGRRYGLVRAIVLTQGTSTLFMVSLAFAPEAFLACGLYVVRSSLMNMAAPLSDSFLMEIISKEERGFASALNSLVWRLPHSATTIVGGLLLSAGYYDIPFFLAAGFYMVSIAMFYLTFRSAPVSTVKAADTAQCP